MRSDCFSQCSDYNFVYFLPFVGFFTHVFHHFLFMAQKAHTINWRLLVPSKSTAQSPNYELLILPSAFCTSVTIFLLPHSRPYLYAIITSLRCCGVSLNSLWHFGHHHSLKLCSVGSKNTRCPHRPVPYVRFDIYFSLVCVYLPIPSRIQNIYRMLL